MAGEAVEADEDQCWWVLGKGFRQRRGHSNGWRREQLLEGAELSFGAADALTAQAAKTLGNLSPAPVDDKSVICAIVTDHQFQGMLHQT